MTALYLETGCQLRASAACATYLDCSSRHALVAGAAKRENPGYADWELKGRCALGKAESIQYRINEFSEPGDYADLLQSSFTARCRKIDF